MALDLPRSCPAGQDPIGKTTIAGYGDALACLDQFVAALTALPR